MNLFKLVGSVFVDTQDASNSLQKLDGTATTTGGKLAALGNTMKSAGDKITSVGKGMTTAVTLPIVGVGVASVKTAADFDKSMSQVQATMGITKDSMSDLNGESVNTMQALEDLSKEMGANTAFSAKECSEALNYLALAGYNTQQMYDTLPTVLNLAAAGNMDLASASDMVTDSMSALGIETNKADEFVDKMAKTASQSNTSVEQLGNAILAVGGTAKVLKGGTTELNTVLGLLADNGIKGAEGGTKLRNILLAMNPTTDKAAKAWEQLGVSAYDAEGNLRPMEDVFQDLNKAMSGMSDQEKTAILSKMFNKADLKAVNALLGTTTDRWDSLSSAIEDSGGAAQQMADTQLDNLSGQLTLLKSALEGAAITIGEQLMPYIKSLTEKVQSAVDWFNGLSESQQRLIIKIALIVAAIGPVLMIIGTLVSGIGTIITVVGGLITAISAGATIFGALATVFGVVNIAALGIVAVIAAVIAIGVLLYKNWDKIKAKAQELAQKVGEKWNQLKETIKSKIDAIKTKVDEVKTKFQDLKDKIEKAVGKIREAVAKKFGEVKDKIQPFIDIIKKAKEQFEEFKEKVTAPITFLKNLKMPHIKYKEYTVLGKTYKIPNDVEWYAKAVNNPYLLNSATVFGQAGNKMLGGGETADEMIYGRQNLLNDIAEASNSSAVVGALNQLYSLLSTYLPTISEHDVVLDSGALVGSTIALYDKAMGQRLRRK